MTTRLFAASDRRRYHDRYGNIILPGAGGGLAEQTIVNVRHKSTERSPYAVGFRTEFMLVSRRGEKRGTRGEERAGERPPLINAGKENASLSFSLFYLPYRAKNLRSLSRHDATRSARYGKYLARGALAMSARSRRSRDVRATTRVVGSLKLI